MNRRKFLKDLSSTTLTLAALPALDAPSVWAAPAQDASSWMPPALAKTWLEQWQKSILSGARSRYCDKELGEEIGWLITPFLSGFYYGWRATHDAAWVDRLVDWTDSWVRRGLTEPDGFIGWPKRDAAGTDTDQLNSYNADSLLGEAMALRPGHAHGRPNPERPRPQGQNIRTRRKIISNFPNRSFAKWDQRGAWRDTANGGGISIVLPFGTWTRRATGKWSDGYAKRLDPAIGFSHPDNKANAVALWLLACPMSPEKPFTRPAPKSGFA